MHSDFYSVHGSSSGTTSRSVLIQVKGEVIERGALSDSSRIAERQNLFVPGPDSKGGNGVRHLTAPPCEHYLAKEKVV